MIFRGAHTFFFLCTACGTTGADGDDSSPGGSASPSSDASGGDDTDGPSNDGTAEAGPTGDDSSGSGSEDDGETDPTGDPPAEPAYVPNLFVTADATGDGDGSEANPWTLQQGFSLAVAGDIVQIGPGVYSGAGGTSEEEPAFGIAHAGTAAQPIIFFAEHPAAYTDDPALRSKVRNTNQADVSEAPTLTTHSHVIIDGLWFDYADGGLPSARGVVYNPYETEGQKLRRLRFDRRSLGGADDDDNYNCIQGHRNPGLEITDSRFVGGYDADGSHNESSITLYGCLDAVIEHNTFESVTAAIFFKGSGGPGPDGGLLGNSGVVRFNRFTSCKHCVLLGENEDPLLSQVYQNLFYYDETVATPNQAIEFDNSVPTEQRNGQVFANTIVMQPAMAEGGITSQNSNLLTNTVVRDNLVAYATASDQVLVNFWEIASLSPFAEFDYNWYANGGDAPTFAVNGEIFEGLAAWRSGSGRDANAGFGDPMFVDAESDDYRLAAGSPAATASSSGGPVGCYIEGDEVMGIRTAPPY